MFRLIDPCSAVRPRCAISLSRSIALAGVSSRPAQSGRRRDGVLTREPAIGVAGALLGIIMFVLSPRLMLGDKRRSFGCRRDRKSTRLNSSHVSISYAVFCLKKKKKQ